MLETKKRRFRADGESFDSSAGTGGKSVVQEFAGIDRDGRRVSRRKKENRWFRPLVFLSISARHWRHPVVPYPLIPPIINIF